MGTTIIMVTHDPELARRAHRNVQVVDGQLSDFKPYEAHTAPATRPRAAVSRGSLSMFAYYLRLALASFKRNPGLTALMVFAIALGISVCMITLTSFRAAAANPAGERSAILFAPSIDSWDPENGYDSPTDGPETGRPVAPTMLTYRDAVALYASTIPDRKLIMYKAGGIYQPPRQGHGAGVHRDAHDHGGFLPDVRDAVSVRRCLGREGGYRPRARGGAQQGNQPEGLRRREQRRQDRALARSRIPRGRRAQRLGAVPQVLRREQRLVQ